MATAGEDLKTAKDDIQRIKDALSATNVETFFQDGGGDLDAIKKSFIDKTKPATSIHKVNAETAIRAYAKAVKNVTSPA